MATDSMPTLAEQIMQASEAAWKRLRRALKVKTREEAVDLVNTDNEAAATAQSILSAQRGSALTNAAAPGGALTQPPVEIPTGKSRQPRMQF